VSDERVRATERRYLESGDPQDREAWERERLRTGELVVFRCARCGVAVSQAVAALAPEQGEGDLTDGADHVPPGTYRRTAEDEDDLPPAGRGAYVVNGRDLRGTQPHKDPRRRSGCCGPDGSLGPNLLCANGHEVGIEHADCWMPHFVALPPGLARPAR